MLSNPVFRPGCPPANDTSLVLDRDTPEEWTSFTRRLGTDNTSVRTASVDGAAAWAVRGANDCCTCLLASDSSASAHSSLPTYTYECTSMSMGVFRDDGWGTGAGAGGGGLATGPTPAAKSGSGGEGTRGGGLRRMGSRPWEVVIHKKREGLQRRRGTVHQAVLGNHDDQGGSWARYTAAGTLKVEERAVNPQGLHVLWLVLVLPEACRVHRPCHACKAQQAQASTSQARPATAPREATNAEAQQQRQRKQQESLG
jgi:hypothetical protein